MSAPQSKHQQGTATYRAQYQQSSEEGLWNGGNRGRARRLCWLGHVARMEEDRLPKRLLFGWLPQRRPAHGTKMRWRDKVRKDFKKFQNDEDVWYRIAQERATWRAACKSGLTACTSERLEQERSRREAGRQPEPTPTGAPFTCDTCLRNFKRQQDIARHKCVRSRDEGRLAPRPAGTVMRQSRLCPTTMKLVCDACGRSFRRRQDYTRHNCQMTRHRGQRSQLS